VPSCFVMGRHPVDRAISYYYERCYTAQSCVGFQRRVNSLTAEELETIGVYERMGMYNEGNRSIVIVDEGMEDAMCRMMTDQKVC
jgi:hypothetical protein